MVCISGIRCRHSRSIGRVASIATVSPMPEFNVRGASKTSMEYVIESSRASMTPTFADTAISFVLLHLRSSAQVRPKLTELWMTEDRLHSARETVDITMLRVMISVLASIVRSDPDLRAVVYRQPHVHPQSNRVEGVALFAHQARGHDPQCQPQTGSTDSDFSG